MPSRIVELSKLIAEKTKEVDDYFSQNGLPTPSFDIDGPSRIVIPPTEESIGRARMAVLDATKELHQLMSGPTAVLMGTSANDCLSLQTIYRYKIAETLPLGQERSFEDLSEVVGLNIVDLRRILRHAMSNSIFREPRAGIVAHTAASKLLAENRLIQDFVGIAVEERFPATAQSLEAMVQYDGLYEPGKTPFALAHRTNKGLYEELAGHPTRQQRFAGAMSAYAATLSLEPVLSGFPWESFGKATVVDVGGGWGPVSVGLAQRFSRLQFTVQDLAIVVAEGPDHVPRDVRERVSFMAHDILEPQPVKGAEIYLFRAVFHNWPDEYCVRILRNHVSALRTGSRVVIIDSCLHEPNTLGLTSEGRRRSMDLSMLSFFGSRERTVDDWKEIIREADPRLCLRSFTTLPKAIDFILDIEWRES